MWYPNVADNDDAQFAFSRDGITWQEARSAPVQEQGEFYAVVSTGEGVVAVGSFGQPDDFIPTVWLSPGR